MTTYEYLLTLDGPTAEEIANIEAEADELTSVWYEFGNES